MTYKLESTIAKISCPVVLMFDGKKKKFKNGESAAEADFDRRLLVDEIKISGEMIEIFLKEVNLPLTNWIGEEQTFF